MGQDWGTGTWKYRQEVQGQGKGSLVEEGEKALSIWGVAEVSRKQERL